MVELEAERERLTGDLAEAQREFASLTTTTRATTETLAAQLEVASASWEAALDQLNVAKGEADALQGRAAKELAEVTSDRDNLKGMLDQERRRIEEMSGTARQEAEAREEALTQLRAVGDMMVEKLEEEEARAACVLADAKAVSASPPRFLDRS